MAIVTVRVLCVHSLAQFPHIRPQCDNLPHDVGKTREVPVGTPESFREGNTNRGAPPHEKLCSTVLKTSLQKGPLAVSQGWRGQWFPQTINFGN